MTRFVICGSASALVAVKQACRDELCMSLVQAYGQSELGGLDPMVRCACVVGRPDPQAGQIPKQSSSYCPTPVRSQMS